jgi:hypothetical protein
MAILAGGHGMNTRQRKFGFIVIKLDPLSPALLVMAFVTFLTFLPFVNVIGFVAVITEFPQLFLVGVSSVAVQACQFGVASFQLKFGVLVVTEFHLGPFFKAMTGFTFFAKTPFMVVIASVAVDTFPFQFFLEVSSLMAGIAFRLIMGATKRKLGFVVIEFGLRPAYGVVAFVAFLSKPSLVNIVERVAVNAF